MKRAAVLLAFLISCLPLYWPGQGMLKTKSGKEIGWEKSSIPVLLVIDPNAWEWEDTIEEACQAWNTAVGFTAILPLGVSDAAIDLKGSTVGVVTVHARTETERLAWVTYKADEETGFMIEATVFLPVGDLHSDDQKMVIATHELGHVLGLAHDPNTCSIMYSKANAGQQIQPDDVKRLQEWYGG